MDKLQPERSLEKISKGALKEAIKNTKKVFGIGKKQSNPRKQEIIPTKDFEYCKICDAEKSVISIVKYSVLSNIWMKP